MEVLESSILHYNRYYNNVPKSICNPLIIKIHAIFIQNFYSYPVLDGGVGNVTDFSSIQINKIYFLV